VGKKFRDFVVGGKNAVGKVHSGKVKMGKTRGAGQRCIKSLCGWYLIVLFMWKAVKKVFQKEKTDWPGSKPTELIHMVKGGRSILNLNLHFFTLVSDQIV